MTHRSRVQLVASCRAPPGLLLNLLNGDITGAERDVEALEGLAGGVTEGQYVAMQALVVAALAIETERWEAAVHIVADALARDLDRRA